MVTGDRTDSAWLPPLGIGLFALAAVVMFKAQNRLKTTHCENPVAERRLSRMFDAVVIATFALSSLIFAIFTNNRASWTCFAVILVIGMIRLIRGRREGATDAS
jgi:hypothetical protein